MAIMAELSQMRFLSVVLPALTLSTHVLLTLSSALPGLDPGEHGTFYSIIYNVLAAGASILGLVGAVRSIPSFVSAYIIMHTTTLLFVTVAVATMISPFDLPLWNPIMSSWQVDEAAICRDVDAGLGWDDEWLLPCSKSFSIIRVCVACVELSLIFAQWIALISVRRWAKEMRFQQRRAASDVEGILGHDDAWVASEKSVGEE